MSDNWRSVPAYKRWQTLVLKRDGFRCLKCGTQDDLVSDHIKSCDLYPTLRYVVSNGRTLCRDCHGKYGIKTYQLKPNANIMAGVPRVFKLGNSLAITLPTKWIKKQGIQVGDTLAYFFNSEYLAFVPSSTQDAEGV